jgi:hypothetical protein
MIFAVLLTSQAPGKPASAPAPSPADPTPAATPPPIPVELLKDFYAADSARLRAQAELAQANKSVESANQAWQQAVTAMQRACGDGFQLYQDSVNADPQCREKMKPPAAVGAPRPKPTSMEKK